MSTQPAQGAWRLAAGCLAAGAVVGLLVVWRSLHTDGAWLLALRLTGALAVVGLLAATWLALRSTPARELVLRVSSADDGPVTETVPSAPATPADGAASLRRALAVALLAVAPVLLVAVLAVPAQAGQDQAAQPTSSEPTSSEPTSSAPTTEPTPSPSETSPPPAEPPPATEPPVATEPPPAEAPGDPSACPSGGAPAPYDVVEGDTLWGLAERSLLGSGTNAEIDAGWRQLYALNREVVGADPDLLLPGQRLLACR